MEILKTSIIHDLNEEIQNQQNNELFNKIWKEKEIANQQKTETKTKLKEMTQILGTKQQEEANKFLDTYFKDADDYQPNKSRTNNSLENNYGEQIINNRYDQGSSKILSTDFFFNEVQCIYGSYISVV